MVDTVLDDHSYVFCAGVTTTSGQPWDDEIRLAVSIAFVNVSGECHAGKRRVLHQGENLLGEC
jgi:hypothetical protein